MPENKKNQASADLNSYITELFTSHPNFEFVEYNPDLLLMDLQACFGYDFDAGVMEELLRDTLKHEDGYYIFRREDYIRKEVAP